MMLGAGSMIEAGLMENPKVDATMMIHVVAGMPFKTGQVMVQQPGVGSSAADWRGALCRMCDGMVEK